MNEATSIGRPGPGEFLPYFGRYIDLVPDGNLLPILETQAETVAAALIALTREAATRHPAPAEWSPLDIGVHLADTERVLAHRAFVFARDDGAELPGVDFEAFAVAARADDRTIASVVDELAAVRAATVALLRDLPADAWTRGGDASGSWITVRALAYVIAGHDLHHLPDLRAAVGTP